MVSPGPGPARNQSLQRLLSITNEILQADDIEPAVESIARGFAQAFGWRYATIVAADAATGELRRRTLYGYAPDITRDRANEVIPRSELADILLPDNEVVPNCFHILAEHGKDTSHTIYAGDLPRNAPRAEGLWHERDLLVFVLPDRDGSMLGYLSCDHPLDGRLPALDVLREMQVYVNLLGWAIASARAKHAETERRKAIEKHARLQDEFLSTVAHEVRSPLAGIQGAAALLRYQFERLAPTDRTDLLAVLERSTLRLSAIFDDFLLLGRMDAGSLTLLPSTIDPVSVADESIARMKSEHPERTIQILYLAPVPAVRADEGRLVQVLTNFLSNALKYSPADSPVTVAIEPDERNVRFSVNDTGPGIPAESRPKLFTRFGRLTPSEGSTGLGLYICKQLVTMMDGRIGCDSVPGERTTFWFTLPRAEEPPSRLGA